MSDNTHDILSLTPVKSGTVSTIELTPRSRDTDFAFRFNGLIDIPADGSYTFFLNSDDGSKLSIDGSAVVTNDGMHAMEEKSASSTLTKGIHTFEVLYFQEQQDIHYR